jgi:two-component sensor histidine kinase
VRGHLVDHFHRDMVDDVRLVASELATNALVHAQASFTLTIEGDHRSVLLTVRDGSTLLPVQVNAQLHSTSGRGLSIVDQLSQRWGAAFDATGTKSVWAWFEGDTHDPLPATW